MQHKTKETRFLEESCEVVGSGMSLRDWFAGQVLAGLDHSSYTYKEAAIIAYRTADAMLAARSE